mmetsp:Transcript_37545/g.99928  ORF Transcript_37545/g.99928 Transcript_37545/m.99928 type:complete len:108 (-) Transcript_37545:1495-1818(-)
MQGHHRGHARTSSISSSPASSLVASSALVSARLRFFFSSSAFLSLDLASKRSIAKSHMPSLMAGMKTSDGNLLDSLPGDPWIGWLHVVKVIVDFSIGLGPPLSSSFN